MMRTAELDAVSMAAPGRSGPFTVFGYNALQPFAALSEAVVIVAAGMASMLIYDGLVSAPPGSTVAVSWGVVLMTTLNFVTLSYLTGAYQPRARVRRRSTIIAAIRSWVATFGFLALCAFVFKVGADFSRAFVLIYGVFGAVAVATLRASWPSVVRMAVETNLAFVTNVLVLRIHRSREGSTGVDTDWLQELRVSGLRPVAWSSVALDEDEDAFQSVMVLAHEQVASGRVREIIILAEREVQVDLNGLLERLRVFPLPIRVVLDEVTRDVMARRLTKAGSLVMAEWQRAPLSYAERAVKRALDLSVAFTSLILLSPLFILTALAIKLDSPGPVLFRQSRRGFGGKTFLILKFRSMTVADNGSVIVQASRHDTRITRVGKWIRRTSIDELPQLWNVVRGDMSIVGPRPHAVAHDDHYARFIEEYAFRQHAKPGLTGWAQVKGLRGETPRIENMQARIENDIWYIDNWSIWLDVSIILRTSFVVLGQKTAY